MSFGNVLKVIIYRKDNVSKINVSKGNELKGKVFKKSAPQDSIFLFRKMIENKSMKHQKSSASKKENDGNKYRSIVFSEKMP